MKIIDRYIFMELSKVFLLGLFVLMSILTLEKVNFLSELILDRGLTIWEFIKLLGYTSPAFLAVSIPLAVLLASLITFSHLSADSEIVAMRACGIGFFRILLPVILFSLLAGAIAAYTTLNLQHVGNYRFITTITDAVSRKIGVTLGERLFYDRFPNAVIYVNEKVTGSDDLKGLFIYDNQNPEKPRFITAGSGRLGAVEQQAVLKLKNGNIYSSDGKSFRLIRYDEYELAIDTGLGASRYIYQPREMSNDELRRVIKKRQAENHTAYNERVEIQTRYALPVACIVFGLLGAPLGIRAHRGGRWGGLGIGVLMIVVNYLLLMLGEGLGRDGTLDPVPAVWFPNFLMGSLALFLNFRMSRESMPFRSTIWLQTKWLGVKGRWWGMRTRPGAGG
ncbi:MAG: LPS export ABC transporter permease LptF [Nitrospinota bacterium]